MSERHTYPAGVPCWVDTLQADPAAARGFYERVLGWRFTGDDDYSVARLHGADVAGVGARPDGAPAAAWLTHVRVDEVGAAARRAEELGATRRGRAARRVARGAPRGGPGSDGRGRVPLGGPSGARAPSASTSRAPGR